MNFPIVLDVGGKPKAIIENAFEVLIKDQLLSDTNGQETLEFKLPFYDDKREFIQSEDRIICKGREFVVRVCEDDKSNGFLSYFMCEASWYDFLDGEPLTEINYKESPDVLIPSIIEGTGWTIGTINVTAQPLNISFDDTEAVTKLQALRNIAKVYSAELYFDTLNKKVNLLDLVGINRDILICYEKNSDSIKRLIDSRTIVTRVYTYGAKGISMSAVNDGKDYIENYSYYDNVGKPHVIKPLIKKDDRFTNPNSLKDWATKLVNSLCYPTTSYQVKVSLIGEVPDLGDSVIVYDKDLNLRGYMRIVKRTINVLELEKSEVELDNVVKNFADQLAEGILNNNTADIQDAIEGAFNDVCMFNLILNSRADDGFNYWINHGFEIDSTNGVSGRACFSCDGALGVEKSIEQEVDVANRSSYVISAQIEIDNITKGAGGEVGFEVTLEYEDGTSETQFITVA